jgi:hypothetical protein
MADRRDDRQEVTRKMRLGMLCGAALLVAAGAAVAQPVTPPQPVRTDKVGDAPASVPEIVEAVRTCAKVTLPAARFDFRHLRDDGWKIGSRSYQLMKDDKPAPGAGELVYVFGRGNTVLSARMTPVQSRCRIVARIADAGQRDVLRAALIEGKVALSFDQAPGHVEFKSAMRERLKGGDLSNILLSDQHVFSLTLNDRPDFMAVTVDVWSLPSAKGNAS